MSCSALRSVENNKIRSKDEGREKEEVEELNLSCSSAVFVGSSNNSNNNNFKQDDHPNDSDSKKINNNSNSSAFVVNSSSQNFEEEEIDAEEEEALLRLEELEREREMITSELTKLGVSLDVATSRRVICEVGSSTAVSAGRMQPNCKLTTGVPQLDALLRGGLPAGSITEICGSAGVGKTQFCLQLLVRSQLPKDAGGMDGKAAYIHTEGSFPHRRLESMAASLWGAKGDSRRKKRMRNEETRGERKKELQVDDGDGEVDEDDGEFDPLSGIFIFDPSTIQDLQHIVHLKLPVLLSEHNVKLIVIDSIAAPFRGEFDGGGAGQGAVRSECLFGLSGQLLRLAQTHHAAIVVSNQVSASVRPMSIIQQQQQQQQQQNSIFRYEEDQIKPAMGISWSHCITSRLLLTRLRPAASSAAAASIATNNNNNYGDHDYSLGSSSSSSSALPVESRKLQVAFSPYLPPADAHFAITARGLDECSCWRCQAASVGF